MKPLLSAIAAAVFFSLPAFAYTEKELSFASAELTLKGYLTLPDAPGPHPALILQMGHGQGTTDHPTRAYNPFAWLARALAGQGFAVYRFDKRGTGYNSLNGSYADGLFSDYVRDLEAAVKAVAEQREVDASRLYLFGHSLGGPVISVAAGNLPGVRGIILSSAPGRRYADFNLEQMRYLYQWGERLEGEALEKAVEDVRRANSLIGKPAEFCRAFALFCSERGGKTYLYGQSAEFWREIEALDPLAALRALPVALRVASVQGTSDWVISSENDGGAIAGVFKGDARFTAIHLEGLDHFLLQLESKKASVEKFSGGMKGELAIHPEFIPSVTAILKTWEQR